MSNQTTAPGATAPAPSRTVWLIGGVLAAAALSAGAGMMMRNAMPAPASQSGAAAPATAVAEKPADAQRLAAAAQAQPAQPAPAAKPATCHDCGVIESVRTVTRKGQASGVGAVAGGVLGGVVGNQFGKGNGRSAMTVLGAVGGGVAGHEIEKRAKSVTVHEVKVRMDDGSVRTIEQAQAPRTGDRVVVQGKTLKPAPGAASAG